VGLGKGGDVGVGFPKTAEEREQDVVTTNRTTTTITVALKRDFMITCPYLWIEIVNQ
jgi:hypothetical protein